MKAVSHPVQSDRSSYQEIEIPELEEAAARYRPHKFSWSDRDIAILKKYYGRVPVQSLESTLHRQTTKIHEKAVELGTERGKPFEGY